MHSSWTLPILISWMTALWPQNSLMNGMQVIRNTKNYKSLTFAAIQDHLQVKVWFNLPVCISEVILSMLQLFQVMSHKMDTSNCVLLLLVLNVAKVTSCIVIVGFGLIMHGCNRQSGSFRWSWLKKSSYWVSRCRKDPLAGPRLS